MTDTNDNIAVSDLLKRLREYSGNALNDMNEAADLIEQQAADNKQLWVTNSELRGDIQGTCNMCNWIERDACSSEKENLKQRIAELQRHIQYAIDRELGTLKDTERFEAALEDKE